MAESTQRKKIHLLVLHGNGGSVTRFLQAIEYFSRIRPEVNLIIPQLPGFDNRPLPVSDNYWDTFLEAVYKSITSIEKESIVFYGHGIGGSLLMELAARDYTFPNGKRIVPSKLILHSIIGASLDKRFFPTLMKPLWIRSLMKKAITASWLRSMWVKRLFRNPEKIPIHIQHRFFNDYNNCAAFSIFFDLITIEWYNRIKGKIDDNNMILLWGEKERILDIKYMGLWKDDFPNATIDIVKNWDHFPMMDETDDFCKKLLTLL
jgi:pimeloyl-ACP methyl ester carboxylesterase